MSLDNPQLPGGPMSGVVAKAVEYMVDAGQRSVLLLDILRQRGDQYREHVAQTAPHVLSYAAELILHGRTLEQPVNYGLVRIIPPKRAEMVRDAKDLVDLAIVVPSDDTQRIQEGHITIGHIIFQQVEQELFG